MLAKLNTELDEWRSHFTTALNGDTPVEAPELQTNQKIRVDIGTITKEEIKRALTRLKRNSTLKIYLQMVKCAR